jgi:hypothetical protein
MSQAYRAYHSAKGRCNNPANKRFADWGGRGIQFLFTSFDEFYAELGEPPTLGRIDNDDHYRPGNVRWDTKQ